MAVQITPRSRRRLVWVGVVGGVLAVAWFMTLEDADGVRVVETPAIDALIMPGDTYSESLEAVSATMQAMLRRLAALEASNVAERDARRRELQHLSATLQAEMLSADAARRRAAEIELGSLRAEMAALGIAVPEGTAPTPRETPAAEAGPSVLSLPSGDGAAAVDALKGAGDDEAAPSAPAPSPEAAPVERKPRPNAFARSEPVPPQVLSAEELQAAFERSGGSGGSRVATPASVSAAGLEATPDVGVRLVAAATASGPRRSAVGGAEVFLPTGSILSGVLLTGLDAPGGSAAKANPVPVLLRLKHEAILPNRFGADVRECFALLSAFGDLSSERASMRGEQISCILMDGTVMQRPLKAYGVGEDGKAGTRGRVVTRQGAFIARAILVGVLDGVAQAFNDGVQVSVGQAESAGGAAISGFGVGFGSAFDRIADWYLEQADALFPVIEIDVGRSVDIVLTEGLEFRLDLGGVR
ncbi:TraB/VirB10 family protein [Rubrimonas cliftonensis]|uniref:Conjugation TrbI-like protein n=1 Tax=Rubrimonas cliftonensis TaxID=89524 RepID=A0A1H4EPU0_9RHOB|nr:TraB/VirB10 family protein [Rubrimonas cliftonensis]SEA87031.1 conjugation TrbI-like protein [Rubrimonas cliftonensis]